MDKHIVKMGHFTAIGMRTKVENPDALVINTCGKNDTSEIGDDKTWAWSNPTNRIITHAYADVQAVSLECLWQGTKIRQGMTQPSPACLGGNWRLGKGKKPLGAWAGEGQPLITTPGEARRKIYIPAFQNLINHWIDTSDEVLQRLQAAMKYKHPIYLRDFDTGRGLDRNGPLSHAWVLCMYLNNNEWPK